MLILKGDYGKSRVVDFLMDKSNSLCFMYYDHPVIFNSIGLDSREYSLEDFLECISDTLKRVVIEDKHYDYLIIYTNNDEIDLQGIINWINKHRWDIPCRDVILTCV